MAVLGQGQRAWEVAVAYSFVTVYDATYLALAELRRCEFWTAPVARIQAARRQRPFLYPIAGHTTTPASHDTDPKASRFAILIRRYGPERAGSAVGGA